MANGNLCTSVLSPMHTILAQEKQLWALAVSHDRSNFVDISVRGREVPAKFQNHSGCSIVCTCKPNKCKTSFLIYIDLHPKKALKPHLRFLHIFHSTFVTPSGLQKWSNIGKMTINRLYKSVSLCKINSVSTSQKEIRQ